MITVASIDDLPDSVPSVVVEALSLAKSLHDRANDHELWGKQPGFVFNYSRLANGKLGIGIQQLGKDHNDTCVLDDELVRQIYDGEIDLRPGAHIATAAFAEAMLFRDPARSEAMAERWSTLRGRKLNRAIASALRKRKITQQRVTMIAFSDGWKCEYIEHRNVAEPTIHVYDPSDNPTLHPTFDLVIALDQKLSTRDVRGWLPGPPPLKLRVHTSDLIAAYTGFTVSIDRSVTGIWRMAEFMINRELPQAVTDTGEKVVFQLVRAIETVRPTLAAEFPWLDEIVMPNFDDLTDAQCRTALRVWLDKVIAEHGAIQEVPRLPAGVWEDKDPVAELREMARDDATIIAAMPLNGTWETFTNPAPGLFRNPRLDEDAR